MPTLFLEIPDHANTIRRTSMLGVVLNTLEQLGLDKDYIHYSDVETNMAQPGTSVGEVQEVKFGTENRVMLEMEERRDSFNLVDRGLSYRFQIPIFKDVKWGIIVTPACARHNVTANLTSRFRSRGEASEWINYMHRRVAMFGDVFETEASLNYPIPSEVVAILRIMYLTGSRRVALSETFEEYAKRLWHPNVTTLTTDTGTSDQLVVRTTFGRIIVIMEGSGDIVAEKEDSGAYNARMTLTFQIDWPEGLKVEYPCVVNNSLIPPALWHINELPGTANVDSYEKTDVVEAQDSLTTHLDVVPLPVVVPPIGHPQFHSHHRTATQVDLIAAFLEFGNELPEVTDPLDLAADVDKWLCNINDLGNVALSPETIEYIRSSYSTDPSGKDSVIKFYTYKHMYAIHNATRVDQEGNVWLVGTEVSLEEEYRMSITLELDFKHLTTVGKEHVKHNIPWLIQIIKDFFPVIIPEWPWLFPGYPVENTVEATHPYWPTVRPWLPWTNPTWPDDYVEWWVEDELAIGDVVIKPDDTVEVTFDPSHPAWEELIEDIANNDDIKLGKTTHASTIIALRN